MPKPNKVQTWNKTKKTLLGILSVNLSALNLLCGFRFYQEYIRRFSLFVEQPPAFVLRDTLRGRGRVSLRGYRTCVYVGSLYVARKILIHTNWFRFLHIISAAEQRVRVGVYPSATLRSQLWSVTIIIIVSAFCLILASLFGRIPLNRYPGTGIYLLIFCVIFGLYVRVYERFALTMGSFYM